jgi:hypothetical protein
MRILLAIVFIYTILLFGCQPYATFKAVPDSSMVELDSTDYSLTPSITPIPAELVEKYQLIKSTAILINNWSDIKGAQKLLKKHETNNDDYYYASALLNFTLQSFSKSETELNKIQGDEFDLAKEILLADIFLFKKPLTNNKDEILAKYEDLKSKVAGKPHLKTYIESRINSINKMLEKQNPITFIMSPWNL